VKRDRVEAQAFPGHTCRIPAASPAGDGVLLGQCGGALVEHLQGALRLQPVLGLPVLLEVITDLQTRVARLQADHQVELV
jgi:hypothetical protein